VAENRQKEEFLEGPRIMKEFLVAERQRVPLRRRPRPRDSAPATTGSLTQNRIVWL